MGLYDSLKEYASDSLLPAPSYWNEQGWFIRLRLNITQSARRVSEQHYYSEKCAIAASQFLKRFYMSDLSSDDNMHGIFLLAPN